MRWIFVTALSFFVLWGCSDSMPDGSSWSLAEHAPGDATETETDETPPDSSAPTPAPVAIDEPEPLYAQSIVGLWLIEQPYHALYEATWYDFTADGALAEISSETYGHEIPTGTLGRCDEWSPQTDDFCAEFDASGQCTRYHDPYCTGWAQTRCTFGDHWWSENEQTLAIQTQCTDGTARTAFFDVAELLDGLAEAPRVISVDGEEGWSHDMWDWRWLKCSGPETPDNCRTFSP